MATTTYHILSVAKRSNRTITSSAQDWPPAVNAITVQVVSTDFIDPAETIELTIEHSLDAGATWNLLASNGVMQGGQLDRHGNPLLPALTVMFDDVTAAIPRQVRGSVTVVGSVTFGIDLLVTV